MSNATIYLVSVAILLLGMQPAIAQLSDQLLITEVMWDSSHPGADDDGNGGHANGDWWELLNASDVAIDMTGFMWDDDDRLVGGDFTLFPDFTIQPRELIILVRESLTSVDAVDGFRAAWGLPVAMRVLDEGFFANTGSGDTFSGLGSGGDELNLYDAEGELVQAVELDVAVQGVSFGWRFDDGEFEELGFSEIGSFAARPALSDGSDMIRSDPNYLAPALDVSSAGAVAGFEVMFPGEMADSLDDLCGQVAAGSFLASEFAVVLQSRGLLPGDADESGSVQFTDFLRLSSNFGQSGKLHSEGDFDCDGSVAFADFLILSANFGKSFTDDQTSSVPEPSCWGLLLCGLLWIRKLSNEGYISSQTV